MLAVAPHLCIVRPRLAVGLHRHVAKPSLVNGAGQRQPLRLRLRQRLLRCHRRGQGCDSLGLGRSSDVKRRLLGRGKAADMNVLAVAPHCCLVRPHLAVRSRKHVAIPALVVGAGQRQPLRLRLRQRFLPCHRRRQVRGIPRPGRSGDVQRRLLSRDEGADMNALAVAIHTCGVRPHLPANVHSNVAKPALVIGPGQRQPLRLHLRQRLRRCHRRGQGFIILRLGRSGDVKRRLLGRGEAAKGDLLAVAPHACLVRPRLALSVHSHVAEPALAV
eukprot:scaffold28817_cov55-Phaeocystis_antarctica.AAC.1